MSANFSNLFECPKDGKFVGNRCPLCDWNPSAPVAAVSERVADTYDRTGWFPGPEKELHSLFENELIRRGVSYIHSRTDLKSTCANGTPDFACMFTAPDGICRGCFVELKNKTGRTSKDQDAVIADLRAKNVPVLVTGNFREAVEFIRHHLNLSCTPP